MLCFLWRCFIIPSQINVNCYFIWKDIICAHQNVITNNEGLLLSKNDLYLSLYSFSLSDLYLYVIKKSRYLEFYWNIYFLFIGHIQILSFNKGVLILPIKLKNRVIYYLLSMHNLNMNVFSTWWFHSLFEVLYYLQITNHSYV